MTAAAARPAPSRSLTIAGIALIVIPVLAAAVKIASFGWFMVAWIWMIYPIAILLIGWLLQIVIAASGFFGRRALFAVAGRRRATIAAWLTSAGVLLAAFFFVDGQDMTWGSTFMYWTGTGGDDGVGAVSSLLTWLAVAAWLVGWFWLLVEWVVGLVRRARARRR